jgi:glucose/arabinose dehydrogenase
MRRCLALVAAVLLAGCAGSVDGITVPDGFSVEVLADGFDRPTQIVPAGDGRLLVAQLAGAEGDGTGEIVAFAPSDPDAREVLFTDLDKPTGIVAVGETIWVMQRNSLWRGSITGGGLSVVLDDLPFNGRSEGTLTETPDGRVLFDTSGTLRDGQVVEGSGALWMIDDAGIPELVASGFKHAYAHTFATDGALWTTEISDGSYDGTAAMDELIPVEFGVDHGWPSCVGDNRPVARYGGSAASCAAVPSSAAVFEPGATPTSVAIAPWDPDVLLVALWNRGEVVAVDVSERFPVEPRTFLTGIAHPQHLLVFEGRLLVVDHDGGRVLAVAR